MPGRRTGADVLRQEAIEIQRREREAQRQEEVEHQMDEEAEREMTEEQDIHIDVSEPEGEDVTIIDASTGQTRMVRTSTLRPTISVRGLEQDMRDHWNTFQARPVRHVALPREEGPQEDAELYKTLAFEDNGDMDPIDIFEEVYKTKFINRKFKAPLPPEPVNEVEEIILNYCELADTFAKEFLSAKYGEYNAERNVDEYNELIHKYEDTILKHKRKINA